MGLKTNLRKFFGRANNTTNSATNITDTSSYLTKNPAKKLKVRTIDATRGNSNLASNTLNKTAGKATKTAFKAKEAGEKVRESTEKIIIGLKEKANHAFE